MSLTGLVFMAVFLAALVIALVRYPVVGLFAYVGEFYVHPPSRWWGEFLPDLRWSMLAAVVTLLAVLLRLPPEQGRQQWFATTPAKIMIVFTAWFWVGSLWALSPEQHHTAAVLITKYIVVYWLVYRLIDTPQKVTAFLLAHLLGCFYLGLLGFQMGGSGRLDGVGGPGIDDSNTLGMYLASGAVVGAMLVLHMRRWWKLVCIVAIAFALNTLVLTGSRGAFLALLAGGMMLAWLRPGAYKRVFYVYAALGLVLFAYVASEQFWSRMDTVTAAVDDSRRTTDTSAESRIVMARAQLTMAARHPLGTGHRGSEFLSARYLDPIYLTSSGARSSHNAFLTVLVEQGIPGAILFFVMVRWVAVSLQRMKRRSRSLDDPAMAPAMDPAMDPAMAPAMAIHVGAVGAALMVVLVGGMFADFSKCEVQIWMFGLLAAITQKSMYAAPSPVAAAAGAGAKSVPATAAVRRLPARDRT